MIFNILRIRIIQLLLNVNKNIKYIHISILFTLLFFTFSIFGFWHVFSGYYHLIILISLIVIFFLILFIYKDNIRFISFKNTNYWLEKKNFTNVNPLSAIKDTPVGENINSVMWNAHIRQTKINIKNMIFYYPKITFESVDPLKIRLIFILFFILSIIWGFNNKVLEKNLAKVFQFELQKQAPLNDQFSIIAWIKPPSYTGLPQKNIEIDSLADETINTLDTPYSSELLIQTFGVHSKSINVNLDGESQYNNKKGNNINITHKLYKSQNIEFDIDNNINFNFYIKIIEDELPQVKFLANPEVVNGVSLKFLTEAKDDYGLVNANVSFSKPLGFEHFLENQLIYDLQVSKDKKNRMLKSLFFKNMSSHIWAGNKSKIKVRVYDDLNQQGTVYRNIVMPEKEFTSSIAKIIYRARSDLAKRKITLYEASQVIDKAILGNKDLYRDELIIAKHAKVSSMFNELKELPLSHKSSFYKNLWELAVVIEEGKLFSVKNNLEQIEQNLFDSINQRETEKISTNVEKFKESIQSLLDVNNEEGKNSLANNENNKNIQDEVNKATKDLEDLLKTGTKENLNEKIQQLKQLADSIKNPKKLDENEILKEQKKQDFINKLSELLNKQEIIMEESFNEAANRGKFKQSSEGSGGRTSKEKQENLRNTLGNIMRDIGESENEIPQELGRADRAMRQATRELDNGRPDQASNAQGRATEMLRRAMNRMRYNDSLAQNSSSKKKSDEDNQFEKNYSDTNNNLEYQGTSLGGTIEVPETKKIQKAQKIAKELYSRYNEKDRSVKEKEYIKNLLDWY